MVDFSKKLSKKLKPKPINPVEIYTTLDRKSETGPLRPAQESILTKWYAERVYEKDLIIKLHTGEEKTLIGLLIAQSKLNSAKEPCLYVCANKYLVQQTCNEADKFGIPYCKTEENKNLPSEFLNGEKILITHAHKVFNGLTKFGIKNKSIKINTIILDDSHACIDVIKNSFTLKLSREHEVYKYIISVFEDDLKEQGEGSYLDIKGGDYETVLMIPYWAWFEKSSVILEVISKYKTENEIKFIWALIKDRFKFCNVLVSGTECELSPFNIPIDLFGSFNNAGHRILMSATTQDDSFFIKGLGFSIDAVKNPMIFDQQKWSGEKMFIVPSLMSDVLSREQMITDLASVRPKGFGIVAITPSFYKAKYFEDLGAIIASSNEILFETVNKLKNNEFSRMLVLVNRYDGIDLPDSSCRILIMDSKPYFDSLSDRYEEKCRNESEIISIKVAQKIEQGFGRSVRGEKDYSVIVLLGSDLIQFVKGKRTNKYFSAQTLKQIELGLEIANEITLEKNEAEIGFSDVRTIINQCLSRDPNWKEYYIENMDQIKEVDSSNKIYEIMRLEREAEILDSKGEHEKTVEIYQKIIDEYCSSDSERGWYLQLLAKFKYNTSKSDSNTFQVSAYKKNFELLKPKIGINYNKLIYLNENRIRRIKDWLTSHSTSEDLILDISSILDNLSFDIDSQKFEKALYDIGMALGFLSQRPEKEFKTGPDNLWCGVNDQYFLFECKNKVEDSRKEIYKFETGQMNNSCGWFKENYRNASVKSVLIIKTNVLAHDANFNDDVEIMRKNKLNDLKQHIKAFFKEFNKMNLSDISDDKINQLLILHKIDIESLKSLYTEKYKRN